MICINSSKQWVQTFWISYRITKNFWTLFNVKRCTCKHWWREIINRINNDWIDEYRKTIVPFIVLTLPSLFLDLATFVQSLSATHLPKEIPSTSNLPPHHYISFSFDCNTSWNVSTATTPKNSFRICEWLKNGT